MSEEHLWVSGESALRRARLILATRQALWRGKERAKKQTRETNLIPNHS